MTDLDAIRARHVPYDEIVDTPFARHFIRKCAACEQDWGENGCDTAIVLAALETNETAYGALLSDLTNETRLARDERDAAIEREARLRAALEAIVRMDYRGNEPPEQAVARVALAIDDQLAALATAPEGK